MASDPDAGDAVTFEVTGGTGSGAFTVDSATGDISVVDSSLINFESASAANLNVRVIDNGGLTDSAVITIQINDVNEPPMLIIPQLSIAEHSETDIAVGVLDVIDPDAGDTTVFDITGGTGATAFRLNNDGTLVVNDPSQLDFEVNDSLSLSVRVTDAGGLTDTESFSIAITDVMESPADFDANGVLNCGDVDSLVQHIASRTDDTDYDLTGDESVDRGDLRQWLSMAGGENLPDGRSYSDGDVNLDGAVDAQDFGQWFAHRFTLSAAFCSGDLNADGGVDVFDFHIWNDSGFSAAPAEAAAALRVPRAAAGTRIDVAIVDPPTTRQRVAVQPLRFAANDDPFRSVDTLAEQPVDRVFQRYTRTSVPSKSRKPRAELDGEVIDDVLGSGF